MKNLASIASVALETGIAKEVLRKWETRYGFPVPLRDDGGHRVYTDEQTSRLKLIKRLIDDGMRPGQVVPLEISQLRALEIGSAEGGAMSPRPAVAEDLLQILQTRDIDLLVHTMRATVLRLGLPHFVMEVAPALTTMVGEAWASAAITIADEHLFSDAMERLIAGEIAQIKQPAGRPRMLLTTPPGELHTLGLLMVEATARLQGAQCIALGAQTPLDQICLAVHDYQADIVGLSFSVAFAKRKIAPLLKDLRTMLPKEIELWAGGAGIVGLDRTPRGVSLFPHLQDVTRALKKIQKARLHLS